MHSINLHLWSRRWRGCGLIVLICLALQSLAWAGDAEHESHHPALAEPGDAEAAGTASPTDPVMPQNTPGLSPPNAAGQTGSAGMGTMMEGMGKMMEGMGHESIRQEIYPTLMGLPEISATSKKKITSLAEERIHSGTLLLQSAQEQLMQAIRNGDHDAASMAIEQINAGTADVESGVAAHRLIVEGSSPQSSALNWFRRTMNLPDPHNPPQLSLFHYTTMIILLAFVVSVVAFHFQRSRRVAALLSKLASAKEQTAVVNAGLYMGRGQGAVPESGQETVRALPAIAQPGSPPSKSNAWTGQLLVTRIFQETPQVKTFRLVSPDYGRLPFSFLPGQFLTFTVNPHGQNIKRSYTISSSPSHLDYCEVTVRHEPGGVVSGYLCERVHEGELLQVTAPSGKFTFIGQDADSIVLIAGGVGVTPMMSVIRYLTERSWFGDIYLIYGSKSEEEVVFREELEYLKRRYPNLHVVLTADNVNPQTWPYPRGRISKELIAESVPEIASRHIHLCGPKPMMEAVKSMLAELGVPPEQVEVEVFVGKEAQRLVAPPPGQDTTAPVFTSTVSFVRSGKVATLTQAKSILEAAEDVGVDIDYSCRVGSCGICKVKLLSGSVTMEVEDALDAQDRSQNIILACQAMPVGDVSIDA